MLIEDKGAKATLVNMFWTANGWRFPRNAPDPVAYEHARTAGYVFGDTTIPHDEAITRVKHLASTIDLSEVADTYIASLSTRRLYLRPFLTSLVVARSLPHHTFVDSLSERFCDVCNEQQQITIDQDILNFERHKWGGVRHYNVDFALFCLERYIIEGEAQPTADDRQLFADILDALRDLPPRVTMTKAESAIRMLKSSKPERHVFLEQLATIDVLAHPGNPGFLHTYPVRREMPPYHFMDRGYPGAWWTSNDGVSLSAVKSIFGLDISR